MMLERTVQADSLKRVLEALANNLTPMENFKAKVLPEQGATIVAPGADVEFTVVHNLGAVPVNYIWNTDRATSVYDSRRSDWTDTEMYLKSSVAGAVIYLVVFP